jgi:ankyrin repeat protein
MCLDCVKVQRMAASSGSDEVALTDGEHQLIEGVKAGNTTEVQRLLAAHSVVTTNLSSSLVSSSSSSKPVLNINGVDAKGYCALTWAASLGHRDIVGLLLRYKPDLDLLDKVDILYHFVIYALDTNDYGYCCQKDGFTPLTWATSSNFGDIVTSLVRARANIDKANSVCHTRSSLRISLTFC